MIKNSTVNELGNLDRQILNLLQANGNLSKLGLAHRTNLSPPATHARVCRLESDGLIQGYAALVDREHAGYNSCASFGSVCRSTSSSRSNASVKPSPRCQMCWSATTSPGNTITC